MCDSGTRIKTLLGTFETIPRVNEVKVCQRRTFKPGCTGAGIFIHEVGAVATVLTRIGQTLIKVVVAIGTRVSGLTIALIRPRLVLADSKVAELGIQRAFVNVLGASRTSPPGRAVTAEAIGQIDACSVVSARVGRAVVDFNGAIVAGESLRTLTLKGADQINTDLAARTDDAFAVVNVRFAVQTAES